MVNSAVIQSFNLSYWSAASLDCCCVRSVLCRGVFPWAGVVCLSLRKPPLRHPGDEITTLVHSFLFLHGRTSDRFGILRCFNRLRQVHDVSRNGVRGRTWIFSGVSLRQTSGSDSITNKVPDRAGPAKTALTADSDLFNINITIRDTF